MGPMLNRQNQGKGITLHKKYIILRVFSIGTEILVRELQRPHLTQNSLNQRCKTTRKITAFTANCSYTHTFFKTPQDCLCLPHF